MSDTPQPSSGPMPRDEFPHVEPAAAGPAVPPAPPPNVRADLAEADQFRAAGDLAAAAVARGRAARALAMAGDARAALAQLDEALALAPGDPALTIMRAELLRLQFQREEALELVRALPGATTADNYARHVVAAAALRDLGRYREAIDELAALPAGRRGDAPVARIEAQARLGLDEYDEALNLAVGFLDDWVVPPPHAAWALAVRGQVRWRRAARATPAGDAATGPAAADPGTAVGQAVAAGIEDLRLATRLDPTLGTAFVELGEALRFTAEFRPALAALDRAAELDPGNALMLRVRAATLAALGRPDEALAEINRAIAANRNNGSAHAIQGMILCTLGKHPEADEALGVAIQNGFDAAWALGLRGWACEVQGEARAGEALRAYDLALELEPDNRQWQIGRANALALSGDAGVADDAEAAAVEYRRLLAVFRQDSDDPRRVPDAAPAEILSWMGWCHYQLGQFEEAVELYQEAAGIDRTDPSVWLDLGLARLRAGVDTSAVDAFQEAARLAAGAVDQGDTFRTAEMDLRRAAGRDPTLARRPAFALVTDLLERAGPIRSAAGGPARLRISDAVLKRLETADIQLTWTTDRGPTGYPEIIYGLADGGIRATNVGGLRGGYLQWIPPEQLLSVNHDAYKKFGGNSPNYIQRVFILKPTDVDKRLVGLMRRFSEFSTVRVVGHDEATRVVRAADPSEQLADFTLAVTRHGNLSGRLIELDAGEEPRQLVTRDPATNARLLNQFYRVWKASAAFDPAWVAADVRRRITGGGGPARDARPT